MSISGSSRIYIALLFAVAIIAAASLLKGSPANFPVQAALSGIGLTLVALKRPACSH